MVRTRSSGSERKEQTTSIRGDLVERAEATPEEERVEVV
jgi:hypothetical protein